MKLDPIIADLQSLVESDVRFAGKSDDDVGRQRRPIERGMKAIDQAKKIVAGVLPVHSPKYRIRSTLQRQVKMRDNLPVGFKHIEQSIIPNRALVSKGSNSPRASRRPGTRVQSDSTV